MTGSQLRKIREDLGLSPTDFASRLGVSSRQFDRYEKEESRISRVVERAVANLLDELATVSVGQSPVKDVSLRRPVAARKSNQIK